MSNIYVTLTLPTQLHNECFHIMFSRQKFNFQKQFETQVKTQNPAEKYPSEEAIF